MLKQITDCIIPCVIALIVCYGLYRKVAVFELFLEGAKEGLEISISILPALIALMTCIGMFQASGAVDWIISWLQPVGQLLGIPKEVLPLALLRPISGSGSLAIFENLLSVYGPDSKIGRIASVLQGSTETTFYTIAVYYSAVGVTHTRHTLPCALAADIVGFIMASVTVLYFFY